MRIRTLVVCFGVAGVLGAFHEASAQSLSLRIENGLVTLDANNVTVDEILARWTAATGLNVVSKSGIGSDTPVTIQLSGVAEREALRTVLRDLSGYIMGERRDPNTGVVTIDRLLILPESGSQGAAAAATPRAVPGPRRSPFARGVPPPPVVAEPSIAEPPAPPVGLEEAIELAPAPDGGRSSGTGRLIGSGPGAVLDFSGGEPNPDPSADVAPPEPAATPNPFGNTRGAARPGEMTPALPTQVQPQVIRSRSADGPPAAGPTPVPTPAAPEP